MAGSPPPTAAPRWSRRRTSAATSGTTTTRGASPTALAELAAKLAPRREGSVPRLLLGGEVRVDSELLADLARPDRAGVLSLAGSRYLLLEFEPSGLGTRPGRARARAPRRGLVADRRPPGGRALFLGERRRSAGASGRGRRALSGDRDEPHRRVRQGRQARVWELLRAGCVQFVASDSHRPDWRSPGLARARAGGRSRARRSASPRS